MEAIYLQSMTDFVIRKYKDELVHSGENWRDFLEKYARITKSYADFLKQPLQLGFFVPCDLDGNILEQPCDIMQIDGCRYCACREYLKAKERVLFKGFEFIREKDESWLFEFNKSPFHIPKNKIVERLLMYSIEFELTDSAIKQIGL